MVALGILIVGGMVGAQSWKQDLRASHVRVQGNRVVPASTITELAGIPRGAKLLTLI